MKVYIVLETSWEYSTIRAACSTRDIANEYIIADNSTPTDAYLEIEEWIIDAKA